MGGLGAIPGPPAILKVILFGSFAILEKEATIMILCATLFPLIGSLMGIYWGYSIAVNSKESNPWKWSCFGGLAGALIPILLSSFVSFTDEGVWPLSNLKGSAGILIGGFVGYLIAIPFESNRWKWACFGGEAGLLLLILNCCCGLYATSLG